MSLSLISFAASLFALTNPIGNVMIFISLTQGYSKEDARSKAIKIMCYAWVGLTLTAIIGAYVLKLFGISIAAFSLAGGILLAHIGFVMTTGDTHSSALNVKHEDTQTDPTLVPLTIPLLVGPGSMVAIISFFGNTHIEMSLFIEAWGIITLMSLLIGGCFYGATFLPSLSPKVTYVTNRIMGLIIGAIGLQLILHAIQLFYHIHI
ncbi:MAG: MarC family protein [Pseudomonadota bacterium]|nr:MarC family protein [Pseudomonadota bacterium]